MKYKVPAAIASLYNAQPSAEARSKLLQDYRDWQEGRFAKAHYAYLEREHERLLKEFLEDKWYSRFVKNFSITTTRAKLAVVAKLKETFKCEEV